MAMGTFPPLSLRPWTVSALSPLRIGEEGKLREKPKRHGAPSRAGAGERGPLLYDDSLNHTFDLGAFLFLCYIW